MSSLDAFEYAGSSAVGFGFALRRCRPRNKRMAWRSRALFSCGPPEPYIYLPHRNTYVVSASSLDAFLL